MKKILIVEDEKPLTRILSLKLNSTGYSTTACFCGEKAVVILAKVVLTLQVRAHS